MIRRDAAHTSQISLRRFRSGEGVFLCATDEAFEELVRTLVPSTERYLRYSEEHPARHAIKTACRWLRMLGRLL